MIDNCQKYDFLDLTPEKYDICISVVVVNGVDTGKLSPVPFRLENLNFVN